jgi:uncharacterized RDD family membrane protein YckC
VDVEYKIIGGDGLEYGPAALDELRSWIRDGRVAGSTQVWRSDKSSWSSADRYSELQPDLTHLYEASRHVAAARLRPVGFWPRMGAFILDRLVLTVIFAVIWGPVASWRHWQLLPPLVPQVLSDANVHQYREELAAWFNNAMVIYYPVFFFYDVLLNTAFGATLGKMAIGARILTVDGLRISFWTAALRWIASRLSDFILFFGYLPIIIRDDKRALHDLLAATKVVYKE